VDAILNNKFGHHSLTNFDREVLSADYARLSQTTAQQVLGFWQARAANSHQKH